jgi:hypothetical protein
MMQNIAQLFKYIECLAKNATFFVNMESTSSVIMSGVQLPTFPMVSDDVFRLVEAAATTVPTSTDEFGEYFAMSLTQVLLGTSRLYYPDSSIGTCGRWDFGFYLSCNGEADVHPDCRKTSGT